MRHLLLVGLLCSRLFATDLSPMTAAETRWERGDEVIFVGENHWVQGLNGFEDQVKWGLVNQRPELAITWSSQHLSSANRLEALYKEQLYRCRATTVVVICLGVGEALEDKSVSPQDLTSDIQAFVTRLRERGSVVVVATPPGLPRKATTAQVQRLDAYAEALRAAFPASPGVTLADLRQAFINAGPGVTDQERLTQAGHDAAAAALAQALGTAMATAPMTVSLESQDFIESTSVPIGVRRVKDPQQVEIRYTTNGKEPDPRTGTIYKGPFRMQSDGTVIAIATQGTTGETARAQATFQKAKARPADRSPGRRQAGLAWEWFPGTWKSCNDLVAGTGALRGVATTPDLASVRADDTHPTPPVLKEKYGLRFTGFIDVAVEGVYRFSLRTDDGSRLWIGDRLVVDNDGWHGTVEQTGQIALREGSHALTIAYFQDNGGATLEVFVEGPSGRKVPLPDLVLSHDPTAKPKAPPKKP
jgi:hypothetical protein